MENELVCLKIILAWLLNMVCFHNPVIYFMRYAVCVSGDKLKAKVGWLTKIIFTDQNQAVFKSSVNICICLNLLWDAVEHLVYNQMWLLVS